MDQERKKRRDGKQIRKQLVMFVQATPNEELIIEIQRCAEKNKIDLWVREKLDSDVRRELQRSNLFRRITDVKNEKFLKFSNETTSPKTYIEDVKGHVCEKETGIGYGQIAKHEAVYI